MPENVCIVYSPTEKSRTLIYKTFTDDKVVFVDQFRADDEWIVTDHMMLSTQVLSYAQEFCSETSQVSFLDLPEPVRVYVVHTTLPENLRVLFYKYDIKATPFGENQLTMVQQTEMLLEYWDLQSHFFSPLSPLHKEEKEEFVALDQPITPIRKPDSAHDAVLTPKNDAAANSDDGKSPEPSRCWAPKKRRISIEGQDSQPTKFTRWDLDFE